MASKCFSAEPVQVPSVKTKFRCICTPLPVPESVPMFQRLEQLETRAMHGQLPAVWDRAEDFQIFDKWGNCWIDFTSTIFVANAGHGNPEIVAALDKVIHKPLLHTYTYLSQERLDYLEALIANTPVQFEKAFLLSAGTEATEAAFKLMRLHGQAKAPMRKGILCFQGNWHGRTMGAQHLSSNEQQKAWIGYPDPFVYHLPFPYPWETQSQLDPVAFFEESLETLLKTCNLDPERDFCGIMMETFQGWGAVFYPKAFVQAVARFAKKYDLLLTFDEMQSGMARTGHLFGYMHYEVEPDLICLGKGVSSSLPLSIVLGPQQILDLPDIGSMSSTHSANPLSCAAGRANLMYILDHDLVGRSRDLGRVFHHALYDIKARFPDHISDVLGEGLLAAVHFNTPKREPLSALCDTISEACFRSGLLVVHTGRETIKLAPPLTISEEAMREGLDVFCECIEAAVTDAQ